MDTSNYRIKINFQ